MTRFEVLATRASRLVVTLPQRVKNVVSDSLELVDFATGLANFILNLPNRQVLFFEEIQITEGL